MVSLCLSLRLPVFLPVCLVLGMIIHSNLQGRQDINSIHTSDWTTCSVHAVTHNNMQGFFWPGWHAPPMRELSNSLVSWNSGVISFISIYHTCWTLQDNLENYVSLNILYVSCNHVCVYSHYQCLDLYL